MRILKKTIAAAVLGVTGFVGGAVASFGGHMTDIAKDQEKAAAFASASERLSAAQTRADAEAILNEPFTADFVDKATASGKLSLALAFVGAVAGATLVGRKKKDADNKPSAPTPQI